MGTGRGALGAIQPFTVVTDTPSCSAICLRVRPWVSRRFMICMLFISGRVSQFANKKQDFFAFCENIC